MKSIKFLLFFLFCCVLNLEGATFLRDRLQGSKPGDYIVTKIDNTYTIILIKEKADCQISIEEITIPAQRLHNNKFPWTGWRQWVESGAAGHTSWLLYTVDCGSGLMQGYFSYSQGQWYNMAEADSFLSTLLNLRFVQIPREKMKRVGVVPPSEKHGQDSRRVWTPIMVYEGKTIQGVEFDAWRTRWPRDSGELSGKSITVYLPKDEKKYPSYFPYWLEIQGMMGKAKIRIIDSGQGITSPKSNPARKIP